MKIQSWIAILLLFGFISVSYGANVTLEWDKEPNSISYFLEISKDSNFIQIIDEKRVNDSSTVLNLEKGFIYYIRVSGINQSGVIGVPSETKTVDLSGTEVSFQGSSKMMDVITANYLYYLGLCYYDKNDPSTAEPYLKDALERNANVIDAVWDGAEPSTAQIGGATYKVCKPAEYGLFPYFRKAFQNYYQQAEEWVALGQIEKAIQILENLQQADPFNKKVQDRLKSLYEKKGETEYPVGWNTPANVDELATICQLLLQR